MIQAKHCDLCEHPKRDFENGLTCGLTDKKPDFIGTCPDILLDDLFQSKLESTNLEFYKIQKGKTKAYLTFYFLIIIGFLMIIGNELYADFTHTKIYSWRFIAIAIGSGITILTNAYFQLNRFRTKLKTAEFNKRKIDSVIEQYGISYNTKFEFKEKIHGNQYIEITTEYINWKEKQTKTLWEYF
ncbi:hypothetical protein [Winogradskyella helgolandensis]|uniref:hypothetical protein n=1 Tax=Winogradskyella helgolandensis TaxID=2697010 RepID=UPI0015CE4EFE|nr:hypothetical protein [Winogradskyella helgolandensis]